MQAFPLNYRRWMTILVDDDNEVFTGVLTIDPFGRRHTVKTYAEAIAYIDSVISAAFPEYAD